MTTLPAKGRRHPMCIGIVAAAVLVAVIWTAQNFGQPPMRRHTTTQSTGQVPLVPATQQPSVANQVSITVEGDVRLIAANGIPDHLTGPFPNRGNPNRIAPQRYLYRVAANPRAANRLTPLGMHNFGIAINGVPFDPGAAEWFLGNPQAGWQYEALSGAVPLGIDASYAHVQPTGAYHYHGLPMKLLEELHVQPNRHSPLIGWAADGFPIYAPYGYSDPDDADSAVKVMRSSYQLKTGARPRGNGQPGGRYDGTFLADYEYVARLGDLDECNGRTTITPEFPEGT